jgi:hypothetical protein
MTVEERIDRLERRVNRYRLALVTLSMVLCSLVLMGATAKLKDEVALTRAEYLRLMIKDSIDWHVGIWEDRVHTKIFFNKQGDKISIGVGLDHPKGVDLSKYQASYPLLENAGRLAAEGVVEGRNWGDDFVVNSFYVSKPVEKVGQ